MKIPPSPESVVETETLTSDECVETTFSNLHAAAISSAHRDEEIGAASITNNSSGLRRTRRSPK